ncbi:hypothetical protein A0H81_00708 [Grifola frondosa]|uniref:Uncharacterized protein n=1 Tax=Grifola frondosa TaxID=5627 RepID=A0A1C7MSW7_GRIFR|nr:hypothetical protein A0H81_00708 [Grifola frondosa]
MSGVRGWLSALLRPEPMPVMSMLSTSLACGVRFWPEERDSDDPRLELLMEVSEEEGGGQLRFDIRLAEHGAMILVSGAVTCLSGEDMRGEVSVDNRV